MGDMHLDYCDVDVVTSVSINGCSFFCQKQKEARLRDGKMKLAMEKIKEASVQQVC